MTFRPLALAALAGLTLGCPSIEVTTCPSGAFCEAEPNDLLSEATLVGLGRSVKGDIVDLDTDVFQVPITATTDLALEVLDGTGQQTCLGLTTSLELLDANGTVLEADDGFSSSGFCATIDPERDQGARELQPGTYFARITTSKTTSADYTFVARPVSVCGDNVVSGSEECDDGNTSSVDGCSQQCKLDATLEMEPNDAPAQANALTPPAKVGAGFDSGSDADYFRFTLAAPAAVTIRTTDWRGGTYCSTVDTQIELLTADGTLIASNDDVQGGFCSRIDPASQAAVGRLAAGSYLVHVRQGFSGTEPYYLLTVLTQPPAP